MSLSSLARRRSRVLLLVLTLSSFSAYPCGGDGPSPLTVLTDIKTSLVALPIEGNPEEFLRWEKKDQVVFRNSEHQLFRTSIKGPAQKLAEMIWPLSSLHHSQDRYLVPEGETRFLNADAVEMKWKEFGGLKQKPEHLFWYGNNLFSMYLDTSGSMPHARVFHYVPGSSSARQICNYPLDAGPEYRYTAGQAYPYASLYQVSKRGAQYFLSRTNLDVTRCRVTVTHFMDGFVAPITNVARMQNPPATYLELDHPTHRIAWWSNGYPCRYYNTYGAVPMTVNPRYPLILTWSVEQGMHLVDLATAIRRPILQGLPVADLQPRHAWLDADKRSLFLAPRLEGETNRSLIRATLR